MFTINDIATHKQVNGELIALTEDERVEIRDKRNTNKEEIEVEEAAMVARKDKRNSAKSKLEALGLTTEEVQEAFGL